MPRPRLVDLSWSPEQIRDFCERNDNWVLQLDPGMGSSDLEVLYHRQLSVPRPYEGLIAEIAGDPRTPASVLQDIWARFAHSVEVLSSLATNDAAPEGMLRQLLRHEHPTIREHAEQALRQRGGL